MEPPDRLRQAHMEPEWNSLPKRAQEWLSSMATLLPTQEQLLHAKLDGTIVTLRTKNDKDGSDGSRQPVETDDYHFNWEQYDRLLESARAGNGKQWNMWRSNTDPTELILLSGADLSGDTIGGSGALYEAILSGANLKRANLRGSDLSDANLRNADLSHAILSEASFIDADLSQADLYMAKADETVFEYCNLTGTKTNGLEYSRGTLFTGSNIESARMTPAVRSALEYNIRRRRWERWTQSFPEMTTERDAKKDGCRRRKPWRLLAFGFWWLSDFGTSTLRILLTFCLVSLVFALVYWSLPRLVCDQSGALSGHDITALIRALYFSVVTMTTLGFGDICAGTTQVWGCIGQLVLALQVFLGYVTLGLLVTRFGVAFTSMGPFVGPRRGSKHDS